MDMDNNETIKLECSDGILEVPMDMYEQSVLIRDYIKSGVSKRFTKAENNDELLDLYWK